MTPTLKIPREVLSRALVDLERPHQFAHERLGFLSFRQSVLGGRPLLLAHEYHTVADEDYIYDPTCGARMGGEAIRLAMMRTARENSGQLWIHTHGRRGTPIPSGIDREEGPRVAQSLANANHTAIHGWAVLAEGAIAGELLMPARQRIPLDRLAVTGYPMTIPHRQTPAPSLGFFDFLRPHLKVGYDRQSFLGPHAQETIGRAKVGIVGLGGGGSHISQQLAHIGFQRVSLCDMDRAEATNLNRLVGASLRDVTKRRYKTAIAASLYRKLQPFAEIDDEPKTWEDKRQALRDCDLIFGCLDSYQSRRDLEAFCRSHFIPLVDIGMKVISGNNASESEIFGQVALSMPGGSCLRCLGVVTEENLALEVQDYGAGPQAQVVWPNGALASAAVGYAVALLTGWSGSTFPPTRLDYRGSLLTLIPSPIGAMMSNVSCKHFPLGLAGDPVFRHL